VGPGDRELQFAALSFDASVEEIFVPLACGAAIVLRSGLADEPARFLARCAEQEITHLSIPTSYWHSLARALDDEELELPPRMRLIVMGGERAFPERWTAWGPASNLSGHRVRLLNGYGPTEATIAATFDEHPGTADPLAGRREVPIGRPLPGVRVHVVDRELRPVPAGAAGELLLGGIGLARGYLDRPELTAERFVPDPFAGLGARHSDLDAGLGARLYRTGDLARFLPDGRLEFAGRLDGQVKVRGFRIELGEVEAALVSHPEVREAAAGTREDASGNQRLVAYVAPRATEAPPDAEALRAFLAERLPAYMLPARFVFLAALPLTSSDKLDRRALAGLGSDLPSEERPFTPPRNPLEETLAAIWSDLLGVSRVGVDDDFFALGGHSLLATQLASRLRRDLGIELPLARLFELRRLGDLAGEVLARTLAEGAAGELLEELDGLSEEEALALLAAEEAEGPA
jgi:acyl-coenzyme A synthetase/AMP-(fatty) acid ligase/acyl carrier protein